MSNKRHKKYANIFDLKELTGFKGKGPFGLLYKTPIKEYTEQEVRTALEHPSVAWPFYFASILGPALALQELFGKTPHYGSAIVKFYTPYLLPIAFGLTEADKPLFESTKELVHTPKYKINKEEIKILKTGIRDYLDNFRKNNIAGANRNYEMLLEQFKDQSNDTAKAVFAVTLALYLKPQHFKLLENDTEYKRIIDKINKEGISDALRTWLNYKIMTDRHKKALLKERLPTIWKIITEPETRK